MVRSQITYTLESAFHMLRHFQEMPQTLEESLTAQGYSRAAIETNLSVPGSRFFPSFASTIDELLNRLFEGHDIQQSAGVNGNILLHATLPLAGNLNGAGTCGVVPKESLTTSQKQKLYQKKNRDIPLWHLDVDRLPVTSAFTVILKPAKDHFIFITAFPGPPALPLPDHEMNKQLYEQCSKFWDNHVFMNVVH